jgi:hypothetical protein
MITLPAGTSPAGGLVRVTVCPTRVCLPTNVNPSLASSSRASEGVAVEPAGDAARELALARGGAVDGVVGEHGHHRAGEPARPPHTSWPIPAAGEFLVVRQPDFPMPAAPMRLISTRPRPEISHPGPPVITPCHSRPRSPVTRGPVHHNSVKGPSFERNANLSAFMGGTHRAAWRLSQIEKAGIMIFTAGSAIEKG